jgi:hypothetical protein
MSKPVAVPVLAMSILKINSTSSLSGRSMLTYRVVCNTDGDIHLAVVGNSSSGQFNATPIPLATIETLLNEHPADKSMSSRVLLPVFRSKSSNSPAFLFAAILAEGLVKQGTEKDSGYLLGDIEAFRQSVSALITAGTDLATPANAVPESPKKKRPAKESE